MDLLITVAGLLVAIYAVVPRDRQLDLRLRLGSIDWVVLVIGSLAVLYLQFYRFFQIRRLGIPQQYHPRGLAAHEAPYLVILAMIV
jgi:hypothetical protein